MANTRSMEKARALSKAGAETGGKHKIEGTSAPASKSRKTGSRDVTEETHSEASSLAEAQGGKAHPSSGAVQPNSREDVPSPNLLEKGIVYFFFRGKVDVDEPQGVQDIARSFIILRPIEKHAKLGDGRIGDAGNCRLCMIPKKALPKGGGDRLIAVVEKAGTSFATLKETFLGSSDYETKTAGHRHSPAATPVGEGVYSITSAGRQNHLAYMLTLPKELGEVQKGVGIKQRGSFIISTRNPKFPPPKNARLSQGPKYSQEVLDEFRDLRWIGTTPKHLDYVNTQFLLVGERSELDKAMQHDDDDDEEKSGDTEAPIEELEKLEEEDTERMEHLGNDESSAIFADLEVSAKDYPKLQTAF